MTRRALFFLIFVLGSGFCFAVNGSEKTAPKPAATATKPLDYSKESFVVEKLRTSYRFENDGTGRREVYARIKLQSEAGVERWGQLIFGYNSANERVEIPYVRVLKADGGTVTAPADAVQDLTAPIEREAPVYTDYRQKHVTVPGLRPGDVLEYDIASVMHTALAPGQFWMQHDFDKSSIILDEELEVNVPEGRTVKVKTQPGLDPKISDQNGRRIYRWSSSHLEREDEDSDNASKKKKKKKEPEQPAVQMTTFASWAEVGRWYGGLEKDRRQPGDEIREKAAELIAGKSSEVDKVQALYDFVAENFRYVSLSFGMGRYQPHAAGEVLHNQYGDCKDKHTLLASLLEATGFHASSVLINSRRKLDPDVPSPAQFDHVITLVPVKDQELWMDTTTEVAPFQMLAFSLRHKQALVIPASGEAHLEETPANPPMPALEADEVEGTVSESGKLEANVHIAVRGDVELLLRTFFRRIPRAQWKTLIKSLSAAGGLSGEVSDLQISDPADTRAAFDIKYHVVADDYLDWSKKKVELPLPLSRIVNTIATPDEDTTDPIPLGAPGESSYHLKLELPAKYTAITPLPFSLKRDYAEYVTSYRLDKNVFTADRKLAIKQRELPPERVSDYLAFQRTLQSDTEQRLTLETQAAANSVPPGMSADELNSSGLRALGEGNFPLAIRLLQEAVKTEPKHKAAWNNLGRAYMGNRQYEEAVAAVQKQIAINPYDEYAYNNLGLAYAAQGKRDQAESAFQKQIEINPLDKYAHANLGSYYVEWHKYPEAVRELEKAISLAPDSAQLQINLGTAYLNLGDDGKAMAAFDKAANLSATPVVWNNIAYQLSLKKVHLDEAQQYAESAVSATTAASRNLRLDQLNERDLGVVQSLSAYWDTLGWVHFAKGDLDKAEKYVQAAWQLSHRPDIADHLAQIYEKRGQTDQAIRMFALALAGEQPEPEIKDRLAALLGGTDKIEAVVKQDGPQLHQLDRYQLNVASPGATKADYFVLFGAGGSVEAIKFVSGDEKLKSLGDAIREAQFGLAYPDGSPVKLLRRGTLACSSDDAPAVPGKTKPRSKPVSALSAGGCTFTLIPAEDVRSLE